MANSIRSTARNLRGARPSIWHRSYFLTLPSRFAVTFSSRRYGSEIKTMKERRNTQPLVVRCKLVLVGDVQCGKTAMLQVLAKDCYPEVMTDNDEHLHNSARVCFPSEFVKTKKDGRRIRAHLADKSCAFYEHFTLVIFNLTFLIDAFTVTPERRLLA